MQINDSTGDYAKNSTVSKGRREAYHHSSHREGPELKYRFLCSIHFHKVSVLPSLVADVLLCRIDMCVRMSDTEVPFQMVKHKKFRRKYNSQKQQYKLHQLPYCVDDDIVNSSSVLARLRQCR